MLWSLMMCVIRRQNFSSRSICRSRSVGRSICESLSGAEGASCVETCERSRRKLLHDRIIYQSEKNHWQALVCLTARIVRSFAESSEAAATAFSDLRNLRTEEELNKIKECLATQHSESKTDVIRRFHFMFLFQVPKLEAE